MNAEICDGPAVALEQYAEVSIAFEVGRVLDLSIEQGGLGGFRLRERPLSAPYPKDYDALAGNHPKDLGRRFDLSTWRLFSARIEGARVGGALVAYGTTDFRVLEGRSDLAVLWDLRVAPARRGGGIGSALLGAAERWAVARGCRKLKVETQNVNVVACRFYAGRGFELGAIQRFAYPELPEEIQLLWYKDLARPAPSPGSGLGKQGTP